LRLAQDVLAAALGALLMALAVGWLAVPAAAQTAVDLQLVLAVDASGSVSEERFELQKHGYVAAFRSPQLARAIGSGPAPPSPLRWCSGPARPFRCKSSLG